MQPHKAGRHFLDPSGSYHTHQISVQIEISYTHTRDDNGAGKVPILADFIRDASRMHDKVWLFPDPLMELVPQPYRHLETHT